MPEEFVPVQLGRKDASGQIARQLRRAISVGQWLPGERLPSEVELAESFDVARATAREALKILAATGLVVSSRGSRGGTYVAVPDAETVAEQLSDAIRLWYRAGNVSLHDVDEARWVLEMQCVDLAARRRTEEDLEAIYQPIHLASNPDLDLAEWLQLDIEFHTAITRAAKNQILELAMMSVHLMRPATNTVFVDLLDREAVWAQHTVIYQAIADQDPEAARAAFQSHVGYLDDTRRKALADVSATDIFVATLPDSSRLAASRPRAE
ncbi:FadR/GntR family transcriptional regulator [Arthrobacter sp. efr-133-TYG-118]|uniref:FadR/GntR family transcriptional regulator n=1 Tax=Arthrobacter sp. efr-133-TYG-118 TaxID=3040279 RepID=UPI0025507DE3|nr:FadR/GntR family transcriptional regulator [Arthrobacter sp. efr-133-TYG-118]